MLSMRCVTSEIACDMGRIGLHYEIVRSKTASGPAGPPGQIIDAMYAELARLEDAGIARTQSCPEHR